MSRILPAASVRRPPRRWVLLTLRTVALLLALCAVPAAAQPAATAFAGLQEIADPGVGGASELAPSAGTPAPQSSDPLPSPNLQRAYWHVFLAFGIAWALILGYIVLLNRRVADAERDLLRFVERRR